VDLAVFYASGFVLIVVGIIVIIMAILLASTRSGAKGKVKGAGVIMIGPVPIIFGTDQKSVKAVLALTIALIIVMLVYYWLLLR
jgi:uncharacterized protein (TIGR00304 family)